MRTEVLVAVALVAAAGCDRGDGGDTQATPADALRVTRADGSRVELPGVMRAWCGPTQGEATDELTGPRGLHVLGGERPGPGAERAQSYWSFVRRVEDVERSARTSLPEQETSGAVLFVLDGRDENELSSADEDEASGTIEVVKWSCERGETVRLAIDATLGSELFEAPSARVEGTVEAEIGDAPAPED